GEIGWTRGAGTVWLDRRIANFQSAGSWPVANFGWHPWFRPRQKNSAGPMAPALAPALAIAPWCSRRPSDRRRRRLGRRLRPAGFGSVPGAYAGARSQSAEAP